MSNNFKLLFVAIISFLLGVVATSFFQTKDLPQSENLSQIQKDASEPTRERKPFFVKIKERSNKIIEKLSYGKSQGLTDKPIATQSDFINLREKVDQFENKSFDQLKAKFKRNFELEDDPQHSLYKKGISQSVDLMFIEKKLFYRADLNEEVSGSKMVLFFHYYACESKAVVKLPLKFDDICYSLTLYSLIHNEWSEIGTSSSGDGLVWKDGTPYSHLMLSGLGDFSKLSSANMAVVPVPGDQDSNINFLKFIDGQFKWVEGTTIKWNDVGPKDADKFHSWSVDYNQRHSKAPQE